MRPSKVTNFCLPHTFLQGVEDLDNHKCNFVHADGNADINDEILEVHEILEMMLDANATIVEFLQHFPRRT